jgi:amidase
MDGSKPSDDDIAFLSAGQCLEMLSDGRLSSLRLVESLQKRIGALDEASTVIALRSIAALSADALDVARELDDERARGELRGPLHGIPVLIKDNIEAFGLPGLAGSTALVGRPSRDAPLVTRLRDAGAIVFGSTNLSQWANIRSPRSTSGYSATGGLVVNPWALDRSAGGSSSGSGAALAAGFAPLAVGTETDGSIVCPASVNGVVGLKPTVGVVPCEFVVPICASQDSPGPMGRSVDDVALLFGVLSAQSEQKFSHTPVFAVASNWRTYHSQTDRLFDEVVGELRDAGATIVERELPIPGNEEYADERTVMFAELLDDLGSYLEARPGEGVRSLEDVIAFEDEHFEEEQRFFEHENFLHAVATGGRRGSVYAEARARNYAWATQSCLGPGLEDVDVLLSPGYGPSWKNDLTVGGHPVVSSVATTPSAIAGWPIMSLPIGLLQGLPVGIALMGRANSEWLMLGAARWIERVVSHRTDWTAPTFRGTQRF